MDKIEYLPASRLQELFNQSQYPALIVSRSLTAVYLRDAHLKEPRRGEKPCTRAQMIRYIEKNGQWVVEVFQYLRPTGELGASGKPDPKRVRVKGTVFVLDVQRPAP